jgi:hypothetical protein
MTWRNISKPDVTLLDQDTSMVDGLGHASLEDKSLKAPCKEVLSSEGKDVIKLVLTLSKQPIAVHAAEQRLTLKDTAGVLLVKCEQVPCSVTDPAQSILDPPQLTLAPQPILTDELQFSIKTLLLIRTPWLLECLTICKRSDSIS